MGNKTKRRPQMSPEDRLALHQAANPRKENPVIPNPLSAPAPIVPEPQEINPLAANLDEMGLPSPHEPASNNSKPSILPEVDGGTEDEEDMSDLVQETILHSQRAIPSEEEHIFQPSGKLPDFDPDHDPEPKNPDAPQVRHNDHAPINNGPALITSKEVKTESLTGVNRLGHPANDDLTRDPSKGTYLGRDPHTGEKLYHKPE